MPIDDRNLEAGTRLVAQYKGIDHALTVEQTDAGLRYRLEDGREFKSPSAAGKAVMGGIACNGWRFWSVAGQVPAHWGRPKARKATKAAKKPAPKRAKKAPKPKAKAARAASRDAYGCGACGETFPTMKAATKHALTHTAA